MLHGYPPGCRAGSASGRAFNPTVPLAGMILPISRLNTAAKQWLNPSRLFGNREVGGGQPISQEVRDAR